MAEQITDPEAVRAMRDIAANYEKIAKRAEAREAGVKFPLRTHRAAEAEEKKKR